MDYRPSFENPQLTTTFNVQEAEEEEEAEKEEEDKLKKTTPKHPHTRGHSSSTSFVQEDANPKGVTRVIRPFDNQPEIVPPAAESVNTPTVHPLSELSQRDT